MSLSNYEIMRNQMRERFKKYNQEKMITKFDLYYGEKFLFLTFVGRNYRIGRMTGIVEWSGDQFQSVHEADYNESMTIYDVLCDSKEGCHASGVFCSIHDARGITPTLPSGGDMHQRTARRYQNCLEQLQYACNTLGKPVELTGDVAAELPVFPFLSVTVQYWDADDEFPASIKFMYDKNILDFMHFETVFFMTNQILRRLEEIADEYAKQVEEKLTNFDEKVLTPT
ncbi:MAG: DUF3786 domain-containing protein [Lachnospiraceae bacterium]|nr:DUF3786 domain-containing protein [Lachnospiraceae bacterium]